MPIWCLREVFGLLNKEAHKNIELIKTTAQKVWGEDCVFGEFKEPNSPYPEFEWYMELYGRFEVRLEYDRGLLGIDVPTKDGDVLVDIATEEPFGFLGYEGIKPENLLHNFQVLDRLLKTYME